MTEKRHGKATVNDEEPYLKKRKTTNKNDQLKHKKNENQEVLQQEQNKYNKYSNYKQSYKSTQLTEKPPDWKEFKKQKKEERTKRKSNNEGYDIIVEANRVCEKLRRKKIEGGQEERNQLVENLHKNILKNKAYVKFALKHDASRCIQLLLKYGNAQIKREISKEVMPFVIQMMQSKYGRHIIKRMLKLGNADTRSDVIKSFYGHAVRLTSHNLSAPIFEFAYSFASPSEKRKLFQEFFGDMYKQSKDDKINHLKDVYANSPDMKAAALNATKTNILKIVNKNLLDSALVHTVIYQFLTECSDEDRTELISQLATHAVILSNSKDGAKVVLHCFWNGTNKDKKAIIKGMKEYVVSLCKHEYGHFVIIGILDASDDTVLVNKLIVSHILEKAYEIASDDWGRKVVLWIIAPADSTHFHPVFIKELEDGRANSSSKKDAQTRRSQILEYAIEKLIECVINSPKDWLATSAITIVTLALLKAGSGKSQKNAYQSIVQALLDKDWKLKEEDEEYYPIEHSAVHLFLKKLIQHEKDCSESQETTFAEVLVNNLTSETAKQWITLSRGCFLLVFVFENGRKHLKAKLVDILQPIKSEIKNQSSKGSKILLKKLKDV